MRYRGLGFSLIEVMITLVILAIMMAAVSPSITEWLVNLRIRNAANALERGLTIARQEAVRRNQNVSFWLVSSASDTNVLDSGCALSSSNGSWVVSVKNPAGYCGASPSVTVSPMLVAKHPVGEGASKVTIEAKSDLGSATTVTFNNLGSVTNTDAVSLISVSSQDTSKCYRNLCVELSGLGVARVCDPLLKSTDVNGCKSSACTLSSACGSSS